MDFPKEEYESRWNRVYDEMDKRGYTTLVVWQRSGGGYDRAGHVWWLSSYASQSSGQIPVRDAGKAGSAFAALIFHERRAPELHTNEPIGTLDMRRIAVADVFAHDHLFLGVAARIRELGAWQVAYVGDDVVPAVHYRELTAATPGTQWMPDDQLLVRPQLVKSKGELDVFREAGEVSSRALTALMEGLIKGERECEAAAEAARIIVAAGGGYHRVCANHGEISETTSWSDPLYGYTTEAPKPGDMVRGWVYGPITKGYWIDPGRSAICGGKPTAEQREAIETCLTIIQTIIDNTRAGVTARQITEKVDKVAREVGYFGDSPLLFQTYGHGLGVFFDRPGLPPNLAPDTRLPESFLFDEPFKAGQVFTAEAFLRRPGVGNATFEDVFIVTDGAPELLTATPHIFW